MPTIRAYDPGQVQGDGGVAARVQVDAPAGAFGVDPAAVASVGQGLDTAGKYLQAWDAEQDEARVSEMARPAQTAFRDLTYGAPDGSATGFLGLSGKEALNARLGVQQQFDRIRGDAMSKAQNDRQRAMLQKVLNSTYDGAVEQVDQHTMAQSKVYAQTEAASQAELHRQNYVSTYGADPFKAASELLTAELYTRRLVQSQNGSEAASDLAVQAMRTKAHAGVLDAYLSTPGQAPKASAYFNAIQAQMDPDTRSQYQTKVHQADLSATSTAFAVSQVATGAAAPGTSGGAVADMIRSVAGTDSAKANDLVTIGMLESSLNPRAPNNGSSVGLFQFHPDTFKALLPNGDINSPQDQAKAAGLLYDQNKAALTQALGRAPTTMELYLAHQQGIAGARALLTADPSLGAVDALMNAGVYKDRSVAARAIAGNAGSVGASVGQFLSTWRTRVATKAGQTAATVGPAVNPTSGQVASLPDWATMEAQARSAAHIAHFDKPEDEQAFVAAARSKYNDLKAQHEAASSEAADQVDRLFASGSPPKSLNDIPPGIRSNLSGAKLKSLTDTFSKADGSGPFAKTTDPATYAGLRMMQANNPQAFIGLDLTDPKLTGGLTQDDFKKLLSDQIDARKGASAPGKTITIERIQKVSEKMLGAAGIITPPRAGVTQKQHVDSQVAQFQGRMLQWADEFQHQNGKPPTDDDIHGQASSFLLRGWQGASRQGKEGYAFEAPSIPGSSFTYDVPSASNRLVTERLKQRLGRPPTPAEFMNAYRALRAAGQVQ